MKAILLLLLTTLSIEAQRINQHYHGPTVFLPKPISLPGSLGGDYPRYIKNPITPIMINSEIPSVSLEKKEQLIQGPYCNISIDYGKGDLQEPQPLLLTDNREPAFLLPNKDKLLIIPANTSILVACPGKNNSLENQGEQSIMKLTCLHKKQFSVNSAVYEFNSFKCKFVPKETVRKSSKCLINHQTYSISFTLGNAEVPLLDICRDESTYRTYYTIMKLDKEISAYQHGFPRPSWKYGSFYPGYDMNKIYKMESQIQSLEILLGSKELATKYIRAEDRQKQFLNRGHLVAKADFIYGAQQKATFWHMNTAPQWASFNSGNWMIIEDNIRNFALTRRMDLIIYTGTYGVMNLTDVNNVQQPVYLLVNETHRAFEVPRFFWKIIHNPDDNRAVAFVGVNDPYAQSITGDMFLCPDISHDPAFSWLTWSPKSIKRGVCYICTVEELRKRVPTVPLVGESGVLV